MKKSSKFHIARATRIAIDSYPGGLCFSTPGGRPILVNNQMGNLIYTLTGHTLMECNVTWEEMKEERTNCRRIRETDWFHAEPEENGKENLFFLFPDESVWHFQRMALPEAGVVQSTATNITKLYLMSAELYQNNQQLIAMHERQRALLENIVQINHSKELLAAKMQIHDELGECLLRAQKARQDGTLAQDHSQISKMWLDTLHNLGSIPEPAADGSAEAELLKVAGMIGCTLSFSGPRPSERRAQLLLFAAVREALMNAVCHAGADRLTVSTEEQPRCYHVCISDNGKLTVPQIREGVGLTGLRKRLEQEGASMRIECGQGVRLILDIPKERDRK